MKKIIASVLMVSLVLSCFGLVAQAKVGDIIGVALHTDIVAYINQNAIPSYAANGQSVIVAEHLRNFGFDVVWNNTDRSLTITKKDDAEIRPMSVVKDMPSGAKYADVFQTDIKVYANNNSSRLTSYAINGVTLIPIEELTMFGEVQWIPDKREIRLTVELPVEKYIGTDVPDFGSVAKKSVEDNFAWAGNLARVYSGNSYPVLEYTDVLGENDWSLKLSDSSVAGIHTEVYSKDKTNILVTTVQGSSFAKIVICWSQNTISQNEAVEFSKTCSDVFFGTSLIKKSGNVGTVPETKKPSISSSSSVSSSSASSKKEEVVPDGVKSSLSKPLASSNTTIIEFNEYSSKPERDVVVQCLSMLTGNKANELANYENRYNDVPDDDEEWRFYEFCVRYVSSSDGSEDVLRASDIIYQDTFYTTKGEKVYVHDMATLGNNFRGKGVLDVELYPGSVANIVIGILVDEDCGTLLLRVPFDGDDHENWISCNPRSKLAATVSSSSSGSSSSSSKSSSSSSSSSKTTSSSSKYYSGSSILNYSYVTGLNPIYTYDEDGIRGYVYKYDSGMSTYESTLENSGWDMYNIEKVDGEWHTAYTKGDELVLIIWDVDGRTVTVTFVED